MEFFSECAGDSIFAGFVGSFLSIFWGILLGRMWFKGKLHEGVHGKGIYEVVFSRHVGQGQYVSILRSGEAYSAHLTPNELKGTFRKGTPADFIPLSGNGNGNGHADIQSVEGTDDPEFAHLQEPLKSLETSRRKRYPVG